jgi:hypothetical protein
LVWSARATELAMCDSRVRKALCARLTVATSTPLPKKPMPVNWPCAVANSAFWREYPSTLALAMLWPVVVSAA